MQLKPQDPIRQYHPKPARPLLAKVTEDDDTTVSEESLAPTELFASTDSLQSQPLTIEEQLEQQIMHYMEQMQQIRADLAVMSEE